MPSLTEEPAGEGRRMKARRSVLVVDDGAEPLEPVAVRLAQLGFHAIRAKSVESAFEALRDPRYVIGAVVIPPSLPTLGLERAVAAFHASGSADELNLLVAGTRPDADRRDRLRSCGVRFALWNPIDDHSLRFQVNRALANGGPALLSRRAERVPTNLPVLVRAAGREKRAKLYSMSAKGAFLATAQPSMQRSLVFFSVPLAQDDIALTAEVVMTNVPGNLVRGNLPIGMGVRFRAVDPSTETALLAFTGERATQLVV